MDCLRMRWSNERSDSREFEFPLDAAAGAAALAGALSLWRARQVRHRKINAHRPRAKWRFESRYAAANLHFYHRGRWLQPMGLRLMTGGWGAGLPPLVSYAVPEYVVAPERVISSAESVPGYEARNLAEVSARDDLFCRGEAPRLLELVSDLMRWHDALDGLAGRSVTEMKTGETK